QRCGNVVGQVADHPQLLARLGQGAEVEFQGVALVQGELRVAAEAGLQHGMQVVIEFDHVKLAAAGEQAFGQGTLARADLDQMLSFARGNAAQDAVDHAVIVQEILTETLARPVWSKFGHCWPRASIMLMAVCRATFRLPTSTRPVPARSNAVPWSTEVRMIGRPRVTFTAWPKPLCLSTGSPWS